MMVMMIEGKVLTFRNFAVTKDMFTLECDTNNYSKGFTPLKDIEI